MVVVLVAYRRRCGPLLAVGLIAMLAMATMATANDTDSAAKVSRQEALGARLQLSDLDGRPIARVERGQPFQITLTIENQAGTDAPAGLTLNGWLRRVSQRNLDCVAAARAWLATRRTPIGSVDLNGPIIASLSAESELSLVDPDLDLASANLIGAERFDSPVTDFIGDHQARRFLFSFADTGEVQAISVLGGEPALLIDGLDRPGTLLAADRGRFWVHEQGTGDVLLIDGDRILARHAVGARDIRGSSAGWAIVARGIDASHLFDRFNGQMLARVPAVALSDVAVLETEDRAFGLAGVRGDRLVLNYLDDPQSVIEVPLPAEASRIAIDPFSRYAFVHSPESAQLSIVDIARGRVAQLVGASVPIEEIAFTDEAVFLRLSDQSMIGVVELDSLRVGERAPVREVTLGQARNVDDLSTTPDSSTAATAFAEGNVMTTGRGNRPQLLARLVPGNEMLAVHAEYYTGFIVHETSLMGDAPPMSSIRLRGAIPERVVAIDRGFNEIATGRFRTTAILPGQGQFELVATTGIGSLSVCLPIPASDDGSTVTIEPGAVVAESVGGKSDHWQLRLTDGEGVPAAALEGEVTFSALETHWRYHDALVTDATGRTRASYKLPPLGDIVVTVDIASGQEFRPLLLRAAP